MANIKLLAVGDISLQTMNDKCPFDGVKNVLQNKDILFGNLETVLSNFSNHGKELEKAVSLHTSIDKVYYIKDAGFDILNLANNHIMDLGTDGFHSTWETLQNEGIRIIGVNDKPELLKYVVIEKQGIKFGFLGYCNDGVNIPEKRVWINRIEISNIIRDIKNIKSQCDFVIVSLHWGTENVFYPSPEQIKLAHRIIDVGATVILGHHPHVLQGLEQYKHGVIAYSLGNFQFNPKASYSKTNDSLILCLDFNKEKLENYHIIPVEIDEEFAPTLSGEAKNKKILSFIEAISEPIKNGRLTENWWFEQIAGEYLSGNMRSCIIRIRKYGLRHLLQCIRWLISPFVIKCYLGIIRSKLATHD